MVETDNFLLLQNDPLSIQESKSYRPNEEELIEKLAKNNTNVDIPTLIEYLKSPALIRKIAKKYDYKISSLRNNIKVKTGGKLLKSTIHGQVYLWNGNLPQ